MQFWFDDDKRLQAAKQFQHQRIEFLKRIWGKDRDLKGEGFDCDSCAIQGALQNCSDKIDAADRVVRLLQAEAELTKRLYRFAANATNYGDFTREREAVDTAMASLQLLSGYWVYPMVLRLCTEKLAAVHWYLISPISSKTP